ncbi:MAG: hypothetical protein KA717_36645 [Woronichinia naegeliana WA131]|uniref:Uncharacterized protein n=1 Tax=Woronichinia naegeliana WA131 TaxID=2824559 RepID=A0A977KW01_9CYAN|nr:MAG: hypothetical protein KA717_36645 [Woronichinia naegeliana WA131]
MLSEALEAARGAIGFNGAEALIEFAPHVPEVLSEALALTRGIGDKSKRAKVLGRLAPYLPESLLPEALEIARAIGNEYYREEALTRLVPHLPESLLPELTFPVKSKIQQCKLLEALSGKGLSNDSLDRKKIF